MKRSEGESEESSAIADVTIAFVNDYERRPRFASGSAYPAQRNF
jgi:hypothetical protein